MLAQLHKTKGIIKQAPFFLSSSRTRLPCSSDSKESACNAGDPGLIPGSVRALGEGNGDPLQYSCLEKPMHRRAWPATVQELERVRYDWATNTLKN